MFTVNQLEKNAWRFLAFLCHCAKSLGGDVVSKLFALAASFGELLAGDLCKFHLRAARRFGEGKAGSLENCVGKPGTFWGQLYGKSIVDTGC